MNAGNVATKPMMVSRNRPVAFDGFSGTPRWTTLEKDHPTQNLLWNHPARFKLVPTGRRGGKTEISKRRLVMALLESISRGWRRNRPWHDPRFFAGAPTRDQAKRVWWNDLKALTPSAIIHNISESTLTITTLWGAELSVIGLDKPQRIEGIPWDGCVIDEFADVKPNAWPANIRPALADRLGWAWLIGVPDRSAPGQVQYRQLYDLAMSGSDPDWACFRWPGSDILDPIEVESLRRQLDDETFRQELLGEFILTGGLAFPDFSPSHISPDAVYDPALPLCWALDFNVEPMCSLAIQHHKGQVRVLGEIVPPGKSSTYAACEAFDLWCEQNNADPRQVAVYGDATGNARDSTSRAGTTDWTIIKEHLRNREPRIKVPGKSPFIKDTVNAVRARLKNAAGESNLIVHPSCKRLIKEFGELLWPSDLEAGHCMAALRYFCEWEYRVSVRRESDARFSV